MEGNYLDELPDELIFIIIEYIDIDRMKIPFIKEIRSLIDLSIRYEKLYKIYMELIYKGIINQYKRFSFDDIRSVICRGEYKYLSLDWNSNDQGSTFNYINNNFFKLYKKQLDQ